MALSIECSAADLVKALNTLRLHPNHAEYDASLRLRLDLLLSAIHFQLLKGHLLGQSSQNVYYRSGSSYLGICTSPARARAYGHPECCFWYGIEDMGVNFLAVIRPSNVLTSSGITSEMVLLTTRLHMEQTRRKQEDRMAYVLATDGALFRFFRMAKHCELTETRCGIGHDYEDVMVLLMSIFADALTPPGYQLISPAEQIEFTEEDYRRDTKRMCAMAVRVGVTVYMDVLQKLPNRLSPEAEKNTLDRLEMLINKATQRLFNAMRTGDYEHRVPDYESLLMANFDAQLKHVLGEAIFVGYNDNQKVLKRAIRKAMMKEIQPVFDEILKEMRKKKLAKLFK